MHLVPPRRDQLAKALHFPFLLQSAQTNFPFVLPPAVGLLSRQTLHCLAKE
jgi:hypothetical protein